MTLVLSRKNLAENYGDRDLDVGNASKRKLLRDKARRSMTIELGALRRCHPSNLSFDTKLPSADGPRANATAPGTALRDQSRTLTFVLPHPLFAEQSETSEPGAAMASVFSLGVIDIPDASLAERIAYVGWSEGRPQSRRKHLGTLRGLLRRRRP